MSDLIFNYEDQMMRRMLADIEEKKAEIVLAKFTEKGYAHLLDEDEDRRFKKIIVEFKNDREYWYVDNGTAEGLLIVTFQVQPPANNGNISEGFKMTMTVNYW